MKKFTTLEYFDQSKKGKRQIISFIRKYYEGATIRDIISGLHKAILRDGKLVGVATDLQMVAQYSKR